MEAEGKRRKVAPAVAWECEKTVERSVGRVEEAAGWVPRYGVTSFIGRRRDMEDAVAVRLGFCRRRGGVHFFGVFDGHGCSHVMIWGFRKSVKSFDHFVVVFFFLICGFLDQVAVSCKDEMCGLVGEEMEGAAGEDWEGVMERSFARLDEIVAAADKDDGARCRCELQSPLCDAVGSTAVVAVVSQDEIVVGNCGDSRAVLCRGGKAVPLSSDHKVCATLNS